jgi:sugar lactone lactonase YvrE
MNRRCVPPLRALAALILALDLAACGGGDEPPPPMEGSATVDTAGGTVDGPDGVQLIVPAGTMDTAVTFRIARDGNGAPELLGLNAVSPIYAVTPHGQAFDGSARLSIPLSAAPLLPAGAKPLLLKAEPGGKWRIMKNVSDDPSRLAVDLDGLSYYVIGSCTSTDPTWTIGAVDCPGVDHKLELNLSDGAGGPPILVGTGVNTPAWTVTDSPQTLFMGAFFTRPEGTNRTDQLALAGLPGGFNSTGFRSTWTNQVYDIPPSFGSYGRLFRVTIDPAQVSGATSPNGKMLRVRSYASYSTTAFRVGQGNVAVGFEFQVDFPILVRYTGPQPTISRQPANLGVTAGQPASFTVQAGITPAAALTYQWSRRANASATFVPIPGATAASYNLPTTALGDDGAQFQVVVCAVPTRCVSSNPATLSVTVAPVAPSFTLQPVSIGVAAGQTASFTAAATGIPLPRVEWQSAPAGDPNNFTAVAGAPGCTRTDPPSSGTHTSATCTIGPLGLGDSGRRYRAVAINSATTVNGNPATVTVNPVPVAPTITQQPQSQTTTVGGQATFTVTATGTATLQYTWRLNGTPLPSVSGLEFRPTTTCNGFVNYGNVNATITLTHISAGCNALLVTVEVDNNVLPKAVSNGATLTVNAVTQTLTLLAGNIGGTGSLDGTGADARVMLNPENGIAVDGAGNAYFSETISGRVRKVTPAGVVTTIAGANTPLRGPAGVAIDGTGNVFVAERSVGRIVRISPAGDLSVWAQFLSLPTHLAIDAANNLYVTSETGNRDGLISKIAPNRSISTFHVLGSGEYIGAIAVTGDGSVVYGAGGGTLGGTVVSITSGGTLTVLAGSAGEVGNADGSAAVARFGAINGLAIGTGGALFATDGNNQTVRRIDRSTGSVETVSGASSFPVVPRDGEGTAVGRYESPGGIGAGPAGDLLVGDVATLRRLQTTPTYVVSTLAGKWLQSGGSGGLVYALDVALDGNGDAYVAGFDRIYKVTPAGVVTTHAMTPARYLAFDRTNNVLVAASTSRIWRVSTAVTPIVTDLAGMDQQGYVDATGTNAMFSQIGGLAVDAAGTLFVSERLSHTIRRVTPQGVVSTYAGARDQAGATDGAAAAARVNTPSGLAVDAAGNLLIADSGNLTIRRISTAGIVSTLAGGTAPGSVDGPGLAASFRSPGRLAVDGNGSLLIGDGSTLRRMTTTNVVTTVLGVDGESSVRLGTSPRLNAINGLAVRPDGRAVLASEAAVLEATLP